MKQKIIKYTFITLGMFLLINGMVASCLANMNLGIVLTYVFGAVALSVGLFWGYLSEKIPKAVGYAAFGLVFVVVAVSIFLFSYGLSDTADYTEDAVIVLGTGLRGEEVSSSLKNRLDSAYEYYKKNPECVIVVSGGKGTQEQISEAEGMYRYLLSVGVPEDRMIKEPYSSSTQENFENSKALLDEYFDGDYRICVISNDYHLFRAMHIAKDVGYSDASRCHGVTPWYLVIPSGIRETIVTAKTFVFDIFS